MLRDPEQLTVDVNKFHGICNSNSYSSGTVRCGRLEFGGNVFKHNRCKSKETCCYEDSLFLNFSR
jgi:hypothetical protein